MQTITLNLSNEQAERLQMYAEHYHLSMEEMIVRNIEKLLDSSFGEKEDSVGKGIEYVLNRNHELLQRLA